FAVHFLDDEMLTPEVRPLVFVGRDCQPGGPECCPFKMPRVTWRDCDGTTRATAMKGPSSTRSVMEHHSCSNSSEPWTSFLPARCADLRADAEVRRAVQLSTGPRYSYQPVLTLEGPLAAQDVLAAGTSRLEERLSEKSATTIPTIQRTCPS